MRAGWLCVAGKYSGSSAPRTAPCTRRTPARAWRGRAAAASDLLKLACGRSREEVASNAIEVHVHHLRRKLGPGWVRTLRGVGYALFPPATPPMAGDEGALP